jgi:sulfur carrier protein ThiS
MRIFLGGHLSYYHPDKARWLETDLRGPVWLVDILNHAGIPLGEIYLVVLNGTLADLHETIVSEGDELKLFSPIGGG